METSVLDRDLGEACGRLEGDEIEGSYVFSIGDMLLRESVELISIGDAVSLHQFATLPNDARTLRATGKFSSPAELSLPAGLAWRASLSINGIERASRMFDGRSFFMSDIGANVASLAGQAVQLVFTLRAVDPDQMLPIDFGTLVRWHNSREHIYAPSNNVEVWENVVGVAGDAIAAGAARPTLQSNAYLTHSAVRFTSTTQVMSMPTSDVVPFEQWSVFALCRPDNDANEHVIINIATAPSSGSSLRVSTLGTTHRVNMTSVAPTALLATVASVPFAVPHVLVVTCDGYRRRIYVDGALAAQDSADQSNLRAALLTGNIGDAVSSFGGDLFELGAFGSALSSWEVALLTAGLRSQYEIP